MVHGPCQCRRRWLLVLAYKQLKKLVDSKRMTRQEGSERIVQAGKLTLFKRRGSPCGGE